MKYRGGSVHLAVASSVSRNEHVDVRPHGIICESLKCCVATSPNLAVLLNHLNAELNPIRHLLALVGARHIVHVSRVRVNKTSAHHLAP